MESFKIYAIKALSIAETFGVIALVIAAIALAGVRFVGVTPYSVLSGSMNPTIPTGSLLYVTKTDPYQLVQGDVITFVNPADTVVTHRIVEVQNVEPSQDQSLSESSQQDFEEQGKYLAFRTKGDANQSVDGSPVRPQDVLGKPIACIPYAGYVASAIQSPVGILIIAGLLTLWGLSTWLPILFFGHTKKSSHSGCEEFSVGHSVGRSTERSKELSQVA